MCVSVFAGLCSCRYDYYIIKEGKTWHEAHDYCRSKYISLASVDNKEDMGRLRAAAGSGYSGTVWIGLHDTWDWRWSLGNHKMGYTSWKEGEPNELRKHQNTCVYYKYGQWIDEPCSTPLMFVCFDGTSAGE